MNSIGLGFAVGLPCTRLCQSKFSRVPISLMERATTFLYQEFFNLSERSSNDLISSTIDEIFHPKIMDHGGVVLQRKGPLLLLKIQDIHEAEEYVEDALELVETFARKSESATFQIRFFLFQSDSPEPGPWEKNLVRFARQHLPREPGLFSSQKIFGVRYQLGEMVYEEGKRALFRMQKLQAGPQTQSRLGTAIKTFAALLILFTVVLGYQVMAPKLANLWSKYHYGPLMNALEEERFSALYSRLEARSGDARGRELDRALEAYGNHLWEQGSGFGKDVSRESEMKRLTKLRNSFPWSESVEFHSLLFQSLVSSRGGGETFGNWQKLYHNYAEGSSSRTASLLELMLIMEADPYFLLSPTWKILQKEENTRLSHAWKRSVAATLYSSLDGKEQFFEQVRDSSLSDHLLTVLRHTALSNNPVLQANAFRLILSHDVPTAEQVLHFLRVQTEMGAQVREDLVRLSEQPNPSTGAKILEVLEEFLREIRSNPKLSFYEEDIRVCIEKMRAR